MFDKEGEMKTAKSAGSPAFMPPELCVAKHGHVSGRAADIWSMGCTLYCLLFGRIPFERTGMLELYQSIRVDSLVLDTECNPELTDLLHKLMEKDPQKRITMDEIRVSRLNRLVRSIPAHHDRNTHGSHGKARILCSQNLKMSRQSSNLRQTKKSMLPLPVTWAILSLW